MACYRPSVRADEDLLQAWREGDASAGNELFDRYFDPLFRFFQSKVDDAAEDLVQQTFLAIVRASDGFRNESSFRTYVFTAARSKLYRHLSTRAAKDGPVDFGVDSVAAIAPTPATWAADREEQRLLHEALRRLPVDMQVALELYHLEGFEGHEIATILEVPEGTVRSRLRRGLERLRKEVERLARHPALVERSLAVLPPRHEAHDDADDEPDAVSS
jgi:RNA polymerase sigma factor (sigma-70 family)